MVKYKVQFVGLSITLWCPYFRRESPAGHTIYDSALHTAHKLLITYTNQRKCDHRTFLFRFLGLSVVCGETGGGGMTRWAEEAQWWSRQQRVTSANHQQLLSPLRAEVLLPVDGEFWFSCELSFLLYVWIEFPLCSVYALCFYERELPVTDSMWCH